jgi:putative restriction endonuclease
MVDFRADLPRLLPAKYAPIQTSGFGNQGAYFSKIHEELARFVLQKGYPELVDSLVGFASEEPASVSDLGLPIVSDWEDRVQKSIESSLIEETTRSALVHARRGQGLFRKKVLEFERQCRVTTVDNPSHLVASHIKPWRESSNEERLSAGNGLMLTPSVDHLFDRGFISFEDSGELIVSSNVDRVSLRKMAVDPEVRPNVGKFNQDQKHFLNYHREEVLLRALC